MSPLGDTDLAPISSGTDAQTLYNWLCSIIAECIRAPQISQPGYCLLCRRFSYDLNVHLALYGPHAEAWAHAILARGGTRGRRGSAGAGSAKLSIAEWSRFVLFTDVWIRAEMHNTTSAERRALDWLLEQRDLIPFEEEEDVCEPRYSLQQVAEFAPVIGLDFVRPFMYRLVEWAEKTVLTLREKKRKDPEFSNRV